jgi:hypothetical protein
MKGRPRPASPTAKSQIMNIGQVYAVSANRPGRNGVNAASGDPFQHRLNKAAKTEGAPAAKSGSKRPPGGCTLSPEGASVGRPSPEGLREGDLAALNATGGRSFANRYRSRAQG